MPDEVSKLASTLVGPVPRVPYASETEKDHYAAIGRVAGEWAVFEFYLDYYTSLLLDINDDVAVCLQSQVIGSARKLDSYIAAARWRGATKENKNLEQFAKDTASLGEERNRIVHDSWSSNEGAPVRFEMTARRLIRRRLIPTPTQKVLDLSFRINDHINRFRALHTRVCAALAPSPGTPPSTSP